MNQNIAVVAGGFSGEADVSLRSGRALVEWFKQSDERLESGVKPYLIIVYPHRWVVSFEDGLELDIDKRDFSFTIGEDKVKFDFAYITIHGTPGEDGIMQGYFDMVGIPYNTGPVAAEALTFNKFYCNRFLSTFDGIRVASSIRLKEPISSEEEAQEYVERLGLPMFVKPNTGGSSIATSKVSSIEELMPAVALALTESREVMLERFIGGVEITCGCYLDYTRMNANGEVGEVCALPITEVVSKNSFFDFNAKYNGEVEEITPARLNDGTTLLVQNLTKEIYLRTDAKGVIRVDFIIEEDGYPTLLEVNTTPGMTPTSFIPQQVAAANMTMPEFLMKIVSFPLAMKKLGGLFKS